MTLHAHPAHLTRPLIASMYGMIASRVGSAASTCTWTCSFHFSSSVIEQSLLGLLHVAEHSMWRLCKRADTYAGVQLLSLRDDVAAAGHAAAGKQHLKQGLAIAGKVQVHPCSELCDSAAMFRAQGIILGRHAALCAYCRCMYSQHLVPSKPLTLKPLYGRG